MKQTLIDIERPDDSGMYDDATLLSIIAERFEHDRDAITRRDARWVVSLAEWAIEHGYGDQLILGAKA